MDRSWRAIPRDGLYFLVLVARNGDVLAPKVEAVGGAEVIVKALALTVCVAEVKRRFGGPESSRSSANLDGCADTTEVLLLSPESVRLYFGRVADRLTD